MAHFSFSKAGLGLLALIGALSLTTACTPEEVSPRGHHAGGCSHGSTTTPTTTTSTDTTTTAARTGN